MTAIIDEQVVWTISGASFFDTANVKKGENVLYIGGNTALLSELAKANVNVTPALLAKNRTFDIALTSLNLHKKEGVEILLKQIFAQLKPGGRLVADLAELDTLRQAGTFVYKKSLPDYWDLLREIGFEAIFVQQITACSREEVALQGWDELKKVKKLPVKVNRFVALKGY
ncbi:hypothetical protein [Bacillus sp. Hm123]|uniref:hypothetical protein n=1 Tax=Bacillus sp. Hm123 TaxID=3450745 RepID=UPI003F4403E9